MKVLCKLRKARAKQDQISLTIIIVSVAHMISYVCVYGCKCVCVDMHCDMSLNDFESRPAC